MKISITLITVPLLLKKLFVNVVWGFSTNKKIIYLSFDDGPTPIITTWTLDVLKQFNAKATFFCLGKNIDKHPEIFNKIIADGHAVGNHTYSHLKGWKTKTKSYLKDIEMAQKTIDRHAPKRTNKKHNLFRPPYGQIKPRQAKKMNKLGYKVIMWSVLSTDYDVSTTKEACLKNVINNTTSGNIVVFHDSVKAYKNMQYALPKVLDYFSKKGYVFKRIPE